MPLRPAPQLIPASLHHLEVYLLGPSSSGFLGTALKLTPAQRPALLLARLSAEEQGVSKVCTTLLMTPIIRSYASSSSAAAQMTSVHRNCHVCGLRQCTIGQPLPSTQIPEAETRKPIQYL